MESDRPTRAVPCRTVNEDTARFGVAFVIDPHIDSVVRQNPLRRQTAEMDRSHVGYIEPPGESQFRGADDVFAVGAPIYKNAACGLDATEILYDRKTLARIGWVNGETAVSEYPFYLSSLAIGEKDAFGGRVVASGWVISNCTSSWNGKSIRIDHMGGQSSANLLARGIDAHDRERPSVASWVRGDTVTFFYSGGIPDGDLMETASIARYRIANGRALHEAPIALTRAGFIHEWLTLEDVNPSDYATAEAVAVRALASRAFDDGLFHWQSVGRCPGVPPSGRSSSESTSYREQSSSESSANAPHNSE